MANSLTINENRIPRSGKLLGLELVRFLSAFAVLMWHYQHFYYVGDKTSAAYIIEGQPLYYIFAPMYHAGYFGVNVFWAISGYIFFWKYGSMISDHNITGRKFFVLRFSRLYPLHFATLLLVMMLQYLYTAQAGHFFVYEFNDMYHFILQIFFASNWGLQSGFSFNGPIWSISTEVLIYFLFFTTFWVTGSRILVPCLAVLVAGAFKVAKVESSLVDCLAFFYVGGLVCVIRAHLERTPLMPLTLLAAWPFVVVAPVIAWLMHIFAYPPFAYLFWLTYAPVLLYVAAGDIPVAGTGRRMIEAAGNMTYSSYLIHFPVQIALALICFGAGVAIPVASSAFLAAYLGITLILAYLLFQLFEKPAQNVIRRRLLSGRSATVAQKSKG